ncbi:MAG: sulfatase [Chloroflexota bacterium]|jgi:arylsulfatase A-like enzyme
MPNNQRDRHFSMAMWSLVFLMTVLTALLTIARPERESTARAATSNQPNIIFVVVDALRADHVSAYGYERPTTPNLDAFMADGVRFNEATSNSPWTLPSNASMLIGRMPSRINVKNWASFSARIPAEDTLLAEYMQRAGYQTAGFVTPFFMWPQFGFGQGFDHYQSLTASELAEYVNETVFDWLDENQSSVGDAPLFLYLYYYDPHTWYDPPSPYETLYDSTYTGSLTAEVYQHGQKVVSGEIVPTERDVEHLIALYDGEITYWDHQLGLMLDRLDNEGLLENSIVIVTADHGQMFGEHGKWVHRNSLYEEVLRVPLFIRYPGSLPAGKVIETPVSLVDILPTLLDLTGQPFPPNLDGFTLMPLINDQPGALIGRHIYAEMHAETDPGSPGYWIAPRHELRSVKDGEWKYILEFQNPAGNALFQVKNDSIYEPENLIAFYPNEAEVYYDQLYDWFRLPTHFHFMAPVQTP